MRRETERIRTNRNPEKYVAAFHGFGFCHGGPDS